KRKDKAAARRAQQSESQITPPEPSSSTETKPAPRTKAKSTGNRLVDDKFAIDIELAQERRDKIKRERELAEAKLNRMAGRMIPTDMVIGLFREHFRSFTDAFRNGSENILTEIAQKAKLNRNDIAELRGQFVKIINNAVDEGVESS